MWERLYAAKAKSDKALEDARQRREHEALAACTFAPNTAAGQDPAAASAPAPTAGAGTGAGRPPRRSGRAGAAAAERLHAEATRRRLARERASSEAQAAEANAFSFHPSTNAAAAPAEVTRTEAGVLAGADPRPLHERAFDVQRAREEALRRRRVSAMTSDAELTFQPRISKRSAALVASRRGSDADPSSTGRGVGPGAAGGSTAGDVTSRLFGEGERRRARMDQRRQEVAADEASRLTFEPRVNASSASLVAANPRLQAGFLERQRDFVRDKEQRLARARDAEAEECTFKPKTSDAGALLSYTRPELSAETERDRADRLATRDADRGRKLKQAISDEYYSQFSHKPRINALSKRLGRAHSVQEHMMDERRRASRARAKEEADRAEMKACTFQPELQTDPDGVLRRAAARRGDGGPFRLGIGDDPGAVGERVQEHLRRKEASVRRQRRAREYEELEACTFVPKPAAEAPRSDKPVAVRGLARHMANAERAERLRAEQAAREEEAFRVKGAAFKAPGEPTVPRPFRLETETSERRKARVARDRAEAEAAAMQECRFVPDTGGMSKELERELMDDAPDTGGR